MKAIVNVNESWGIGRDGELLVNIPEDMRYFRTVTAGGVLIMGRKTLESFPGAKPLKGRVNIVLTREPSRIRQESIAAADVYIGDFRLSRAAIHSSIFVQTSQDDRDFDTENGTEADISSKLEIRVKYSEQGSRDRKYRECLVDDDHVARFRELCHFITSQRDLPAAERPTVLVTADSAETAAVLCRGLDDASVYVIGGASIYEQMLKYCDTCLVTMNDSMREADTYFPNLDLLPEWKLSEQGEMKEHEGVRYHFDTYTRVVKDN